MKILWTAAGVAVVGAIIAAFWISGAKERETERDAVDFAADTVNAISENWNPGVLRRRAEPGLIRAMASQGQSVEELFLVYRKLGASVSDPACAFKDMSQFGGGEKRYLTATVTCDEQFRNGPATFLVTLRRPYDGEEWKVYYLNISSPGFGGASTKQ